MFLRELDGRYKGEIREFPPEVARQLLASGRAENPFAEPVPAVSAPATVAVSLSAQAQRVSVKGRRK
jgi:hypothetical protein